MMHPSTKKLLDRLVEMTRQRRIGWQETSSGTGVAYATEGYTVHLIKEPQALQLSDANGSILEEVSLDDLSATQSETGQSYTAIFDETFREASRQARGTERAIDTVLAGLDLDGDGIPDIPAPAQASQLPSEPTSDVGSYEDMVDETGALDTGAADTSATATGQTLEPEPASPDHGTIARADEAEASLAQTAGEPAGDLAEMAPSLGAVPQGVSQAHGSEAIPAQSEESSEDSATDVGEAVANMASQVNGSGESAPTAPQRSSSSILGGGSFGTSGFGGVSSAYSRPAQRPVAEPSPPAVEQSAEVPAAPEPAPVAAEPGATSHPTYGESPVQDVSPHTEPDREVVSSPDTVSQAPSFSDAAPVSSPFSSEPSSFQSAAKDVGSWQDAERPSAADSPFVGSEASTAETTSSDPSYSEIGDSAFGSPDQGPGDTPLSSGLQDDWQTGATPDWNTPSVPGSSTAFEHSASAEPQEPVSEPPYSDPSTTQADQIPETPDQDSALGALDGAFEAAESQMATAQETVSETAQSVATGVDKAGESVREGLGGAAASLMGSVTRTASPPAATASQTGSPTGSSSQSILGGAAAQVAGAAGSLAAAAETTAGSVGQAMEGVSNKLSPQGILRGDGNPEADADGQAKQKPLTRFNPWS